MKTINKEDLKVLNMRLIEGRVYPDDGCCWEELATNIIETNHPNSKMHTLSVSFIIDLEALRKQYDLTDNDLENQFDILEAAFSDDILKACQT